MVSLREAGMDTDSDIVRAAAGLCKELNYDLKGKKPDMEGFTGDLNKSNTDFQHEFTLSFQTQP